MRSRGSMREVDAAGHVVDVEHLAPGPAAVGRLEHAAFSVAAPEVPHRTDVHRLRIARVDDDGADLLGGLEAEVLPRLAAVDRFVDAVAEPVRLARGRLSRADPDDVRDPTARPRRRRRPPRSPRRKSASSSCRGSSCARRRLQPCTRRRSSAGPARRRRSRHVRTERLDRSGAAESRRGRHDRAVGAAPPPARGRRCR